jgi:hypothetical protein
VRYAANNRLSRPKELPFGGSVYVLPDRDRVEGAEFYRVQYEPANGSTWRSQRLASRDQADIAALILSEYVRAVLR